MTGFSADRIRSAGAILVRTMNLLAGKVRPGVSTAELDQAAERFILDRWGPDVTSQRRAPQHPKSALQELAAARDLRAPVYEVVARTGAHHAPMFTVRVSVPTLGEATADGTSKQEAETAAAEALLSQLK